MTEDELKQKWPAVDAAFSYVIPSYNLMASRFEAADARLSVLATLATTITLGFPVLAKNARPDISFESPLLWISVAIFVGSVWAGLAARVRGSVMLPDPTVMYEKSLHRSAWSFKMNQIAYAGRHFRANQEVVRVKGNVARAMTVALLFEVIFMIAWLGW